MAKEKTANEVGIIGQMYESRKTKKVGVLESREDKYKTLLMRDPDGKTFNVTYSTFRSDWRKYTGEQTAQTSTQVKEEKAKTEKKKTEAKKTVEKKTDEVRLTTEDKVKKLRAVEDIAESAIKTSGVDLKLTRTSKGCVVVRYKKYSLFEIWTKFNLDKYDFVVREDIVAFDRDKFDSIIHNSEYTYKEDWKLKHCCRVNSDKFEQVLLELLTTSKAYIESLQENKEDNKEEK